MAKWFRSLDLKSGGSNPGLNRPTYCYLDLFSVARGQLLDRIVQIVNWMASNQLGFLVYFIFNLKYLFIHLQYPQYI